ncbi:MAG: outer membrane beta-barrel domain-containing protein [Kofleriaceae bacterium]|jgi:outer membrane beta-barrel protein|nr:outer membrane beta-barrel domain-containing protein [Kofleriaceae bacterium]MBP6836228.1 outer membrane beta-barrel domain-containing protein [Kofleriaceae bacterium]
MRPLAPAARRATLALLLAASALAPATALAQPEEGEIEMGGDEAPPAGGEPEAGEIEMDPDNTKDGDLAADTAAAESDTDAVKASALEAGTSKPVSWSDIVTVIRKPFLKLKRAELMPMLTTTLNDNMVRHYGFGAQVNYYVTDVLAVGIEGQYLVKQFREPFDLVARQARRLPTVNKYNFSTALNFHYVPVYGKFAILDKHLVAWETFFTAGIGVAQSEVIPRDTRFPGFTNILISPNIGASMRFFVTKWATVDIGIRDYIFVDKFEPVDRSSMSNATAEQAKENADSSLINNVMLQLGISFWVPPTFEYTTFR